MSSVSSAWRELHLAALRKVVRDCEADVAYAQGDPSRQPYVAPNHHDLSHAKALLRALVAQETPR